MVIIEEIFRLRRVWNILAILLLSASVNILTGLPGSGWNTKSCLFRVFAIVSIILILLAGVGFQVLFEDVSSYFVAGKGVLSEAVRLVRGMPEEKTLTIRCIC